MMTRAPGGEDEREAVHVVNNMAWWCQTCHISQVTSSSCISQAVLKTSLPAAVCANNEPALHVPCISDCDKLTYCTGEVDPLSIHRPMLGNKFVCN